MWQFWNGYVIIQVEGYSAARFLKRISNAGIRVSNVRRTDDGKLCLKLPATKFKALLRLRRGLPLRVHILKRGGLPFTLRKLWRRPVLWAGSAVLFIGMLFLSSRIFLIRIDETERIDPEEIKAQLNSHGLRPGVRPDGPILITAAEDMAAQIRDAAWVDLDHEGITLHVRIVETLPESAKKTDRVPSDVIAQKDGVVLSVNVMRGQARVKEGDHVHEGDVLISGTILYKDQSVETSADGVVTAAVQYRAEAELSDRITVPTETDNTETVRILRLGRWEISRSEPSFAHYRLTDARIVAVSPLLPITIEKQTAREIVLTERLMSSEEAEQNALAKAREAAFTLVPKDAAIINVYGSFREENGKRFAVAVVTAEETIGRTEENPHDG